MYVGRHRTITSSHTAGRAPATLGAVVGITAGLVLAPVAAAHAAPAAATPSPRTSAAGCRPVTPASLRVTATRPKTVWDTVSVGISGTLPAGSPAGTCVVLPTSHDLPLQTYGDVVGRDAHGVRVGVMSVREDSITFRFDRRYLALHRTVGFSGIVAARPAVDPSRPVVARRVTWRLTPSTRLHVATPACPTCSVIPRYSGVSASLDERRRRTNATIALGARTTAHLRDGARAVLTDTLGPGQRCVTGELWRSVDDRPVKLGDVRCASTNRIAARVRVEPGEAYALHVTTAVTDTRRSGYVHTGRLDVDRTTLGTRSATASWSRPTARLSGR